MNEFFKRYSSLEKLKQAFIDKGISDENFYALPLLQLNEVLINNTELVAEFLTKYAIEQSIKLPAIDNVIDNNKPETSTGHIDIDNDTYSFNISSQDRMNDSTDYNDTLPSSNVIIISSDAHDNLPPSNVEVKSSDISEDTQEFVEKELYALLASTLEGRVILNRYKYTKELSVRRVKEIIVYYLLEKDPIHRTIKADDFATYLHHFEELFPTECSKTFFVPYKYEQSQVVGAHGSLYNFYKVARLHLKKARMLTGSSCVDEIEKSQRYTASDRMHKCLTDPDRSKYSHSDVLESWKLDYEKRKIQLTKVENRKRAVKVDVFLNSFACLANPLALALLEQDFETIVTELRTTEKLQTNLETKQYLSIFSDNWSRTAENIVEYSVNPRLRNPELKIFLEKNGNLVKRDLHSDITAFWLLSCFIQLARKFNTGRRIKKASQVILDGAVVEKEDLVDESYNINREEAFKNFILHTDTVEGLEVTKNEYIDRLNKLNLPIHPFLVFVGNFTNTTAYIIFKNENIYHLDPIRAVQDCFKIHIALRNFPILSEPLWHFIAIEVYGFTHFNSSASVNTLITKLQKRKILRQDRV